jgi:aspartate-semialdehyde dehydrogenase
VKTIGLIGARGDVGRVLVRIVEAHPQLRLGLATSR